MNTFGIYSINNTTFNTGNGGFEQYPGKMRSLTYTVLKIHNVLQMVLGYAGWCQPAAGCLRMILGATLIIAAISSMHPLTAGHFYSEALITGICQIARGILEAFVPGAWPVLLVLDIVATPVNFIRSYHWGGSIRHPTRGQSVVGAIAPGPLPDPSLPKLIGWWKYL